MAIRVDANGDGTNDNVGSYVSVYALLLEGKYDTELSWPFVGKVTFILLNQLEDSNHAIEKASVEYNLSRGLLKFITHSKLAHDLIVDM